jgi:2,3-bisphosphoglycerate-dependent phosphoglycerate mutase
MEPPATILASPFRRCGQTLEPYLQATGQTSIVEEELGEVFVGEWEGMRFEDIVSGDEELARRFREQEAMFSMAPGGESGSQLRDRVVPAVARGVERARGGSLIVVTHGGVINAYLGHVMGIDQDMFFLPDNASISSVIASETGARIKFLNDVRHLTDPAVFTPPAGARARMGTEEGPAPAGPS